MLIDAQQLIIFKMYRAFDANLINDNSLIILRLLRFDSLIRRDLGKGIENVG